MLQNWALKALHTLKWPADFYEVNCFWCSCASALTYIKPNFGVYWGGGGGGGIAQQLAHWLPGPAAPGSILGVPNFPIFKLDLIDVAVI